MNTITNDQWNPAEFDITSERFNRDKNRLEDGYKSGFKKLKPFLKNFKSTNWTRVKIRKNGITSRGGVHMCHLSCVYMSLMYGGRVVVGLHFQHSKNLTALESHSVWENPEGELVDVTRKWTGDDEVGFLPIKYYDPRKEVILLPVGFGYVPERDIYVISDYTYGQSNYDHTFYTKKQLKKIKENLAEKYLDSINHFNSNAKENLPYHSYLIKHLQSLQSHILEFADEKDKTRIENRFNEVIENL